MAVVFSSANRTAATVCGKSRAPDEVAAKLVALVRAGAARHNRSGAFEGGIVVKKAGAGKDRLVMDVDPLAVPKEFGHVLVRDGHPIGYVRGLHVFRAALDSMRAVG